MTDSERTIIFWGAGATASLGMQTTGDQTKTLQELASTQEERKTLDRRIEDALKHRAKEPWASALHDLLTILGDDREGATSLEGAFVVPVTSHHLEVMRRHWQPGAGDDELRTRIDALRTLYDWPALKAIIKVCPGAKDQGFRLNDLFNVLDMHGQSGHGFRDEHRDFLTPQQVLGARNALKAVLQTTLYIDWQCGREERKEHLKHHYEFANALGRRMQRRGLELARRDISFDSREFYLGDVSFACFNWDPIALWCQFVSNRNLNTSPNVPHVGSPARKLRIFHDLGHFVPGPRVKSKGGRSPETPWHPMNESSVLQLNDDDNGASVRVRISKFLLPHGCLWWRECPNCGKLSSYMGDEWEWDSPTLIPPPPLRAFVQNLEFESRHKKESDAWKRGEVDARVCVHCETLTHAHHTQTIMQSSFKSPPPPFLDEIKRDLRVAVQNANHVILMGYSLPPDDVDYRAFLSARRRRDPNHPVRCSVVTLSEEHGERWYAPSECEAMLPDMKKGEAPRATLEAARDLFGIENVRFYSGGIPNVFVDGGKVTDSVVEKLLRWNE